MIAPCIAASAIIYLVEGAAVAQGLVAQRIVVAEGDPAGRVLTLRAIHLACAPTSSSLAMPSVARRAYEPEATSG